MDEKKGQNVREIIGFVGGLASLGGILIAIIQNINTTRELDVVKAVAKATDKTVKETKSSIKKILNLDDISKFCENTKLIQELLEKQELKVALYLCKNLHEKIIEINNQQDSKLPPSKVSLSPHILSLGKNITYIRKGIMEDAKGVNIEKISEDFDKLHKAMVEIKATLTHI